MAYNITYKKSVGKDISNLGKAEARRILDKIEKDLAARAKAYLPIYRVLIDKAPSDYQRVYIAVEALKSVGTREDIRRLYKYIDHEKAWMRHDVLEGIGRILGIEVKRPLIPSYEMPLPADVKPWEEKTRSIIEQTLIKERPL